MACCEMVECKLCCVNARVLSLTADLNEALALLRDMRSFAGAEYVSQAQVQAWVDVAQAIAGRHDSAGRTPTKP